MSNPAVQATYHHLVVEGTAYECGSQIGEHILMLGGPLLAMYADARPDTPDRRGGDLDAWLALNDRYCPDLNDEMQGIADALGIPMERLAANLLWQAPGGCCSHMAVLPGATADGHVLAARSYEWSLEDEMRLVTTRVRGKYAHIGFSIFACGRFDGMNEQGLCITMSAGAPGKQPTSGGFAFWAGIRAALDTCATVAQAEELVAAMPSCTYDNIILSDRQGNATLIENACGHRAMKRIGAGSPGQFIFSTNHFTLPGMAQRGNPPMWMSAVRHRRIGQALSAAAPAIEREMLRGLLTATVPDGLCCHYYRDWFGTLWSMIFDATAGKVEVCFGPPTANGWYIFGLDDPKGVIQYPVVLPDEACTDPQFFSREFEALQ